MKKNKIFNAMFSMILVCALTLSGVITSKVKANDFNENNLGRARPTEQVIFSHRTNIAASGSQAFTVRITCTNTYVSDVSAFTTYSTGNCSLLSVVGGVAEITGQGAEYKKTPDLKYTAYTVEIDVDYTPNNTTSRKRYTVIFYIVDGVLYDSACEARK